MSAFPRPRRSFTLIELIVVIAVVLLLMAIVLPSFLGTRGGAQDAAVQSNLTVTYHDAKAAWADKGEYPAMTGPKGLLAQLTHAEPGITFVEGALPGGADSDTVGVELDEVDGDQALTLCGRADSGRFFCLRSNEEGKLVEAASHDAGPGFVAAAGVMISRATGSSLTAAKCHLAHLPGDTAADCSAVPGAGTPRWTSNLPAPAAPAAPLMPAVAFVSPAADTLQWPGLAFTTEHADLVECSVDGGPFTPCASPYSKLVGTGEHTLTVRVTNDAGSAEVSHTFTAWSQPNIFGSTPFVSGTTMTFSFDTYNATAVECFVDDAPVPCTSSLLTVTGLAPGTHTGRIVASNPGNTFVYHLPAWTIAG